MATRSAKSVGKVIKKRTVVVLGKTGAGKSSVANNLGGRSVFEVADTPQAVTRKANHLDI